MRIYTRTGDDGTTALLGGSRTSKAAARVDALGTVDELNAVVGVARAVGGDSEVDAALDEIQRELLALGADLAAPADSSATVRRAEAEDVATLETRIDRFEARLPELRALVVPGGTPRSAHLHQARTVCRRAERLLVPLAEAGEVSATALAWVNRLSDLLFVLARFDNHWAGDSDVPWQDA